MADSRVDSREHVVFLHGIWMTGAELALLRRRVRAAGFGVSQFHYHSLRNTPAENARALADFVQTLSAPTIHFVAHSLGGIVLAHYFSQGLVASEADSRRGRVVFLGSPLKGSHAARAYASHRLTRPLLGKSLEAGLLGDIPPWPEEVEAGMIAGDRGVGVGSLLFGGLPKPHDGTVAVEETRLESLRGHICVPHSHFSMLLSPEVAEETIHFLRQGRFLRSACP